MAKVYHLTGNGKGASRPRFDDLPEHVVQLWIAKAQQFMGKQGWTYDAFDYAELVYGTAVFLYEAERLLKPTVQFPCYVVHSQDDDSRFVSGSYTIALGHFKRLGKEQRVALFHWPHEGKCDRLYASDGYAYTTDYGMQEVV